MALEPYMQERVNAAIYQSSRKENHKTLIKQTDEAIKKVKSEITKVRAKRAMLAAKRRLSKVVSGAVDSTLNTKLKYRKVIKSSNVVASAEPVQHPFERSRFFKMPSTKEERMKWL